MDKNKPVYIIGFGGAGFLNKYSDLVLAELEKILVYHPSLLKKEEPLVTKPLLLRSKPIRESRGDRRKRLRNGYNP